MSANEVSIRETWSCCALCQVHLKDVHRYFAQWQSDLQCYTTIRVHVCAGLIRLKKGIRLTWETERKVYVSKNNLSYKLSYELS